MKQTTIVSFAVMVACFTGAAQSIFTSEYPPQLPLAQDALKLQSTMQEAFSVAGGSNGLIPSSIAAKANRQCVAALNSIWFTAPTKCLDLNLFPDAQYNAIIDKVEMINNVSVFYCHIQDHNERPVILAYQDGALAARVPTPENKVFEIYHLSGKQHAILELAPNVRICDLPPQVAGDAPMSSGEPVAVNNTAQSLSSSAATVVDVMVLYTSEAKAAFGQAGINTRIALSIAFANEAFNRSAVAVKLRLVHTEETSNYTETGSFDVALNWLADPSHTGSLVTQYGADLVSMFVSFGGGAARCNLFNSAFDGDPEVFTHEIGHNFGCSHDRGEPKACDAAYGFGYCFTPPGSTASYKTIMAYCTGCACSSIEQFSNPIPLHERC